MTITVYTKPNCVQCEMTKNYFDRNNTAYDVVDITQDQEAYNHIVSLGFASAPVVITPHDAWAGFRLEKIKDAIVKAKHD